ncbi:short chain dehydrogenase [Rhizobium sp. KVB221]|uniref:Short chain dehydrogenase n=1 Tax=Rhizobium setariae TaxID=2801340 RepID=A0A936YMC9_9HYPH|nr:short chain dehydrogenase [Rhizobium setariae]MBL0370789.1 short chain dehydrogenase [Rhizobium setariae]
MKILVVGASGILGSAVASELSKRHDIISASRNGDVKVDIKDVTSIRAMFEQTGKLDAIVCTAGKAHFGPLAEITEEKMSIGIKDKLMGQVNLVLEGTKFLNDGGSFTLVSGILGYEPILSGVNASMVNGAIDSFVKAAAIELPRGIRINAVSATMFEEAIAHYGPYFRGFKPVPVADAALAFSRSVEGHNTGQIYKIGY